MSSEEARKRTKFGVLVGLLVAAVVVSGFLVLFDTLARRIERSSKVLDVVDIQSPSTLALKVRRLAAFPGRKVVLLGDSLVAGQVLAEHGDKDWRQHTISKLLQERYDGVQPGSTMVMNLGMNGILPADLETLSDSLIELRPDAVIMDISLRSFSMDFAAADAMCSRPWLRPGLKFDQAGGLVSLSDASGISSFDRALIELWPSYRIRDFVQARWLKGEPKDLAWALRNRIEKSGAEQETAGPAAEMRLLLQVRGRYASANLEAANPQFEAWLRTLRKLKAAKLKTIVFYATETPRLLPSLMEPEQYNLLAGKLERSAGEGAPIVSYLPANPVLTDDQFLDHVHVDADGNRIYAASLWRALTGAPAASRSLELDIKPFIETIVPDRVELGRLTDFRLAASPDFKETNPRFDLQDYPVLSVESRGPRPPREIIFFYHWWDKSGATMGGAHDSYHMLRSPPDEDDLRPPAVGDPSGQQASEKTYIDLYSGIPSRRNAQKVAFFVQDVLQRGGSHNTEAQITLFGQKIARSDLAEGAEVVKSTQQGLQTGDVAQDVVFGKIAAKDIVGQGAHFQISGVSTVYCLKGNHDIERVASEYLIGSMLPQVVGYQTSDGEFRTLYFSNADLVELHFDQVRGLLDVNAYSYDFRERTTRVSTEDRDADLRRVHRNLGVVNKLPDAKLGIVHTRSRIMAFPLWQPNGNMAALAITEHADYTGVSQDMLTMYGMDAPKLVEGRGILGNHIPVTKSMFPVGPDIKFTGRTQSSPTQGMFVQSSLEGSAELLAQVREYEGAGHEVEVGIHCISSSWPNNQRTPEALDRVLTEFAEFKPVTWVDHGGPECLWESGWDSNSKYYIVPVLKKHGVKYLNSLGDKYSIRTNMIADDGPSNILFYSPGLDDDFDDDWKPLFFATAQFTFGKGDFTKDHIRDIVRARGVINVHTYLPYAALMFEPGAEGTVNLKDNPWYNDQLSNLAAAGKEGDLYLATNRKLNGYIWQVRGISYFTSGGTIHLHNPSKAPVDGLTVGFRDLAPPKRANKPTIAGISPIGQRERDGVSYAWFNLPAGFSE
ncbi:hypothetical protein [Bradyrhizobium sp. 27S5]|uniref:hypothetical protein n=1 Tax=Bradyrhizobium sp. 27S5 TaxID=3139728 RepID=UPI0030D310A6